MKTSSPVTAYSTFHYALLWIRGIDQLFDFLRYERAFFARRADVLSIVEDMRDLNIVLKFRSVLICKYGYNKRPDWRTDRLLSTQDLKEIPAYEAFLHEADFTAAKPTRKLKYLTSWESNGTPHKVLMDMFDNQAFPLTEADAHRIESVPYHPQEKLSVNIGAFTENNWSKR